MFRLWCSSIVVCSLTRVHTKIFGPVLRLLLEFFFVLVSRLEQLVGFFLNPVDVLALSRSRPTSLILSSDNQKPWQGVVHLPKQQLQQSWEKLTAIFVVCRAGKGVGVVVEGVEVAEPGDFLFSVWRASLWIYEVVRHVLLWALSHCILLFRYTRDLGFIVFCDLFDRYSEGSTRYEDDDDFYDNDKAESATSGDETESEPERNPKRRRSKAQPYTSGEDNSEDESLSGKLLYWNSPVLESKSFLRIHFMLVMLVSACTYSGVLISIGVCYLILLQTVPKHIEDVKPMCWSILPHST